MSNNKRSTVRYRFDDSVNLLTAFERTGIEHLEVSNERTIVIYRRTIFNVTVPDGHLDDTQTVDVVIFDISPDLDTGTDPIQLIDRLVEKTATTVSVDWERQQE